MRSALLPIVALPFVAQAVDIAQNLAIVDDNRMVQFDGVLKFPVSGNAGSVIAKRQDGSALGNQLKGGFYTIPLSVGTPGDRVDVVFDTGSWELWVNPNCAKARDPEFCTKFGRLTKSSTLQYLGQQGNLTYGTGYAYVEYAQDTLAVGSARIKDQVFGVARDSAFWETGILGSGPSPRGFDDPQAGYYVIDSLAKQGITKSRAFGLDLQGIESQRGSVVFGGVDTKKFTGTLERLPIIPAASAPDGATRYWVALDSISHTSGKTTLLVGDRQAVFLDSGAQVSQLPAAVVQKLLKVFPGAKKNEYNAYQVDCNIRTNSETLDFKFGTKVIKVAYSDFIYQYPGQNYCVLGFQEGQDNGYSLGDSFLRSAYVVYDQDHQELSVAQSADCGTHLVSIGPGPAGPLVGECNLPVTSTSTTQSTTSTSSGSNSKTSSTETATESKTSTKTSSPSHTGKTTTPPVISSTVVSSHTTIASSSRWGNTTTAAPTYTSTFTSTKVYTITSCPPTVTNCPVGHRTTEVVEVTTTWCPGETAPTQTAVAPPPDHGCLGKGQCPPAEHSSGVVTSAPVPTSQGGSQSPGESGNPTGGLTTIAKPTETSPTANSTLVPPPVTAGAAQRFQGIGGSILMAAVLAVVGAML